MTNVGRDLPAFARRWIEVLASFFAVVLVTSALATGVALADPVQEAAAGCDPIDQSDCLLPWPNDYFTVADAGTATGIRLNVSPLATPRNAAGAPLDPTDWNRLDGFSPGSQIVTHVAGMDNPEAFTKTDLPTNINISRSLNRTSPVVVLDPKEAEAAADRAIGMQQAEIKSRARLDAGEKLPDISGATKMLQEALAKQK